MRRVEIETEDFDLETTLTCGQTFCWHRTEGELYGEGGDEFYSFRNGEPLIVRNTEQGVEAETSLPEDEVRKALGIDHDLERIFEQFPQDSSLEKAWNEFYGLRILQDDFFPCLISYILSSQMQIPVIKRRFDEIADRYGGTVNLAGKQLRRFPTREELSNATEEELRDIGTGYRAEYVVKTVETVGSMDEEGLREMTYYDAKKELKRLHGVGDKVADCVLLFSLGFHEATPLDTWARRAVEHHYPELEVSDYEKTSENLRDRFGEKSGYAVEYLFHAARQGVISSP